jgi:Dolichyl-phosphate-mannose-protein mannosyltransferase
MSNGQIIPTQPVLAFLVGVVLFIIGMVVIRRIAEAERDPWLVKVLTVCLLFHLICAPLQIWVVDHLYGGVSDYNRYDSQGAILANGFRHLDFSLAPANLGGIVSNGSVSIVAGVVFAIIGVNQAAGFMVFSFLAFIGIVYFYRAFTLTFSKEGSHRYGYLIFFLPSLLFWTSDVSKEAIMTFLLGLTSYGCARILAHRGGYWLVIVCSVAGVFIRPNETLLALGGFTIALLIRPVSPKVKFEPTRRTFSLLVLGTMVVIAIFVTTHFLPGTTNGGLSLTKISHNNNTGNGAGFGSSGVTYSGNPVYFFKDVFVVLFDPLPFNAHGGGEWFEAVENTVLVGVVLASLRQLRIVPRAAIARPYVAMCIVFCGAFCYAFAALGNLGLITREATAMLPFFLVPLCIPRGPRHRPPRYLWELRQRERVAIRKAQARRAAAHPPRRAVRA